MRIIILLLLSFSLNAQTVTINGSGTPIKINGVGTKMPVNRTTISWAKNFRRIGTTTTYDAFGHPQRTGDDRITYFYRSGETHLEGGVINARNYTISTDTWSEPFLVYADPSGLDMRDAWGGVMDNDSIVVFSCASEYSGTGTNLKSHSFFIKGDLNFNFTDTFSIFNGVVPEMQRGIPFGGMMKGSEPGTYYMAMWQFNVDSTTPDKPTMPLYRTDVLKTTDYWNTWTVINVQESAVNKHSEAVVAVFPDDNDKMSVFIRRDPGGFLQMYESSDGGDSWTNRLYVNYLGLNGTKTKQPFAYINMAGNLDLMVGDRDDGWIKISRDNHWSDYFGSNVVNDEELYMFNRVGGIYIGDNYKLGYPSTLEIEPGKRISFFAKQEAAATASIWYTLDDNSDPFGIPVAPNLSTGSGSFVDSTSAMVYTMVDDEEGGYTLPELSNIRWFEWCLSTDNFSTFVTTKVRYNTGDAAYTGEINNYRLASHQFNMYDLEPNTTYQVRCRAVNNTGASEWGTIEFTTDPL